MLVLFDHGTPRTLARYLIDRHTVTEARARGGEEVENGELLTLAEAAGFEVLVTTNQNLSYPQNLKGREIALLILGKGQWGLIRPCVPRIVEVVNAATPGSFAVWNSVSLLMNRRGPPAARDNPHFVNRLSSWFH